MAKGIFTLWILIVLAVMDISCRTERIWIETTRDDFADGTFDGGGNLYASWKGDVQIVNSWDLNGDGWLDIFFSNYSNDTSYNITSDIFWGSSAGFDVLRKTSLPTHASIAHAVADFNNDGLMDILFGSWQSKDHDMDEYGPEGRDRFFGSHSLIYWGSDARFEEINVGKLYTYAPTGVSAADVNNDGFLDVVFASSGKEGTDGEDGEITIHWGSEQGFGREVAKFSTIRGMIAFPADLNKDGFMDIIAGNLNEESLSKIYYGSGTGYSEENIIELETSMVRSVAVADLNKDGFLDIIFANGKDKQSFKTDSYIYWGSGEGYSAALRTSLPTVLAMQPSVADFNKDGWLDIVFANCYDGRRFDVSSYIYYGSENGFSVNNKKEIPTCGAHSVAVGDFDGNGELDLVFSSTGDPDGVTADYYSVLYYQKAGEFYPADVKFPTHDGHHNTNRDLGNIYDREYRDIYTSSVFDAKDIVVWRKVEWDAEVPPGCGLRIFLRTRAEDNSATEWMEAENGREIIRNIPGCFCQYRVEFQYDGKGRPRLNEIRIFY